MEDGMNLIRVFHSDTICNTQNLCSTNLKLQPIMALFGTCDLRKEVAQYLISQETRMSKNSDRFDIVCTVLSTTVPDRHLFCINSLLHLPTNSRGLCIV
jgi:hypothetical protein